MALLPDFKKSLGGGVSGDTGEAKPLVMVVDDDDNIRSSLPLVLRDRYRVQAFATGVAAIAAIAAISDDVSVVLLDIKMAGMDGFRTYLHIRERDEDLPIIFHSAYQDLKDPYQVMNEFRPFGFVVKGGDLSAIQSMLACAVQYRARLMRHRKLQEELQEVRTQMQRVRDSGKT